MKAQDLRIGNIYHGDVTNEENPQVITGSDIVDLETDPIDDYFKPILLTEEWLLKFGFEVNRPYSDTYSIDEFIIKVMGDIGFDYVQMDYEGSLDPVIQVKHVHQLQNLYFALTGEELTIK